MKRTLLLLLLIVIAVGAWYAYREYNRTNSSLGESTSTATVTAAALLAAFEKDSAAAVKQYEDKVITVTGLVKKVAAESNPVILFLGEGDQLSSVQCSMDSSDVSHYAAIKAGTNTALKGIVAGFRSDPLFGTDVILNRCVVATHP